MSTGATMRETLAISFKSDLSPDDMLSRLSAQGARSWSKRDNDWYGGYLSSIVRQDDVQSKIRVYFEMEDGRPVVTAFCDSDAADAPKRWAEVEDLLRSRILPALGADDLRVVPYFD